MFYVCIVMIVACSARVGHAHAISWTQRTQTWKNLFAFTWRHVTSTSERKFSRLLTLGRNWVHGKSLRNMTIPSGSYNWHWKIIIFILSISSIILNHFVYLKGAWIGFVLSVAIGLWILIGSLRYPSHPKSLKLTTEECLNDDYIYNDTSTAIYSYATEWLNLTTTAEPAEEERYVWNKYEGRHNKNRAPWHWSFWSGPRAYMAVQSSEGEARGRPRWCPWSAPEGLHGMFIWFFHVHRKLCPG